MLLTVLPKIGLNRLINYNQEKVYFPYHILGFLQDRNMRFSYNPTIQYSTAEKTEKAPALQRPVRQEPGKVYLGFVPEAWVASFYNKTGVSGFYTFMFTFGTYLLSKEKLVMEHEYYSGLSVMVLCYLATTKVGPGIARTLDKEIEAYEATWNQSRIDEKNRLEGSVKEEETLQWSSEGQLMLVEAKRENVALQLEANFRERQMTVYKDVKRYLDYQVALFDIHRRITHLNIIDYVTKNVARSLTPDIQAASIDQCIEHLATLAQSQK